MRGMPRRPPHATRPRSEAAPPPERDTRERILRAALDVFGERGFDGARTRDIAEASGANLGLLQYYFGGKERLWRAAVDHVFGKLWQALDAAPPAAGGVAEIAAVIRTAVRFAAANPALVRLMNDEGKRDGPRLRWLVDRHGRRLYETTAAVLARAQAHGLLTGVEPIHLYYVFIGATGLMFSQSAECKRLSGTDPTRSRALIDAHAETLIQLFTARPAS
jgi:AcrR family transcriptional regulator